MKENVIKDKSCQFADRIIGLTKRLRKKSAENAIINQLLKSGTSIGANVEEAVGSISKAEFSKKISISYKEARETKYWLNLLKRSGTISEEDHKSVFEDCDEISRILWSILRTTRMNKKQ